jgi:transposase
MKSCPSCQSAEHWTLGDGRYKCRTCGARYSWRSVWDSVRLPEAAKQRLIEAFVGGVSVYRQRYDDGACVDSRERFYRLVRAVCALDAHVPRSVTYPTACQSLRGSRRPMRGWAATSVVTIIGIAFENGAVRILPISGTAAAELVPLLREHTAIGGIYCVHEKYGVANLQVQGDYVVLRRNGRAPLAMNAIETFWDYARERLQVFRQIHCRFMHLYLGEMCFRFNHRDVDLVPLLHSLLQSTSSSDARAALRGPKTSGVVRVFSAGPALCIGSIKSRG